MTVAPSHYRVIYMTVDFNEHDHGDGPYNYRSNAIAKRNEVFRLPHVIGCCITKDGIKTGKRLMKRNRK